jgi:hypothetical protein
MFPLSWKQSFRPPVLKVQLKIRRDPDFPQPKGLTPPENILYFNPFANFYFTSPCIPAGCAGFASVCC